MLKADYSPELTPLDHQVFSQLVPEGHYLRRLKAAVDFPQLRPLLADCYSSDMGRGALDPVCLLKLLLLQFHYGWSDESVIQQAQVNVAIRFFLDLSFAAPLPDPSLLTHFRKRLGAERLQRIFDEVLRQARAAGLDVAIVTGDKDFFQLVGDGIRIFNPRDEGTWYDTEGVIEDGRSAQPDRRRDGADGRQHRQHQRRAGDRRKGRSRVDCGPRFTRRTA